jgi:methylthioribulose-1-phosphate dehydratase
MAPHSAAAEMLLAQVARHCYAKGWAVGTSGNFSAVVNHDPLILTISGTGLDKASLSANDFVRVNAAGGVITGSGQPSAETSLHLLIARARQAGAVLHTHSVWSTVVSAVHTQDRGLWIENYEMLKGLDGVRSHLHREWLPILDNDQDMVRLTSVAETVLEQYPGAHAFLLRGHGLYTWGKTVEEAKRHLEILEFLLEVVGRTRCV